MREATALVNDVRYREGSSDVDYDVSATGALVYVREPASAIQRTLVWVSPQGQETPLGTPPRAYAVPRLSPDDSRIALDIDDGDEDIEIWHVGLGQMQRLSREVGQDNSPVWSLDGRHVFYNSLRTDRILIHRHVADGSSPPQVLFTRPGVRFFSAYAMTHDGAALVVRVDGGLGLLTLADSPAILPLLDDPQTTEAMADLSPNGKWLAYLSSERGTPVFVRPFPEISRERIQISTLSGGGPPVFSRDGRGLFWIAADGMMMTAQINAEAPLRPGVAKPLFRASGYFSRGLNRSFDVAKDGRFLMIRNVVTPEKPSVPDVLAVLNWFEEVTGRARK